MLDDGPFEPCKLVLLTTNIVYSYFTGESGDMFTGLSDGAHMIKVRFTPTGSSQAVMLSPPLMFTTPGGKQEELKNTRKDLRAY